AAGDVGLYRHVHVGAGRRLADVDIVAEADQIAADGIDPEDEPRTAGTLGFRLGYRPSVLVRAGPMLSGCSARVSDLSADFVPGPLAGIAGDWILRCNFENGIRSRNGRGPIAGRQRPMKLFGK